MNDTYTQAQYDTFTASFIHTLLWCTSDDSDESVGEPLAANYSIEDIEPDTLKRLGVDCREFLEECAAAGVVFSVAELIHGARGESWTQLEQSAHDYALTRNGHGAGYWDRSEETYGEGVDLEALSTIAADRGEADLYVGDDGKLYVYMERSK